MTQCDLVCDLPWRKGLRCALVLRCGLAGCDLPRRAPGWQAAHGDLSRGDPRWTTFLCDLLVHCGHLGEYDPAVTQRDLVTQSEPRMITFLCDLAHCSEYDSTVTQCGPVTQ